MPRDEWETYLDWLYETEFKKVAIPRPDAVIFLDVPVNVSQRLMSERYLGDEGKKDIHEKDVDYLEHCYNCALFAAEYLGWNVIRCTDGENMRPIDDIADEIYGIVEKALAE